MSTKTEPRRTLHVLADHHKEIRRLAAENDRSVQEITDELLSGVFKKKGKDHDTKR